MLTSNVFTENGNRSEKHGVTVAQSNTLARNDTWAHSDILVRNDTLARGDTLAQNLFCNFFLC